MPSNKINYISLCRKGVFACCTERGISIFNTAAEVMSEISASEIGTVSIFEILNLTPLLLAIVWGGTNPKFDCSEVGFWDDVKKRFVKKIWVPGCILSLKFDGKRLYIVQSEEVAYFDVFSKSERLPKVYSLENPKGVCTVGPYRPSGTKTSGTQTLAVPGESRDIQILAVPGESGDIHIYKIDSSRQSYYNIGDSEKIPKAHKSDITELSLNPDASMIASASLKGTVIRIFSTETKQRLHLLRRGVSFVTINNITFSDDSAFMSSTSSSGTVHVYSLLNYSPSYFSSHISAAVEDSKRSIGTFKVSPDFKAVCSFDREQHIYAISYNGSLQHCKYSEEEGFTVKSLQFFLEPSGEKEDDDKYFDALSHFL